MGNNLKNFYTRLNQLAGVKSANNAPASLSTSTLVEYSRAGNGLALGIVKENHSYFIKTSNSKADKLGAEDFVYINGIENKYKYQYPSLSEAIKNRNFFVQSLNEAATKKFKTIALNENENINKAQVNADSLNAGKAQGEADKAKGEVSLHKADEKKPGEVKSSKEISVEKKEAPKPKVADTAKVSSEKAISVEKQTSPKENAVAKVEKVTTIKENWNKKNVVDPKKKGMFKGKTKEELHKELAGAKKRGDTTKEKEINFALRAKNKWGKVDEKTEIYEGHSIEEYGDEHQVSREEALKENEISVETAKTNENFGEKEPAISSDEPVMPAGETGAVSPDASSDAEAGAEGSAEPELDAAAAALDSMGAGEEGGVGSPDVAGGIEGMEGAEGAVKDIEKYVGKATQKIRATELTPEMAKGFLKSFITAFEGKLTELDHEDRKELAALIMNDEPEGGEESGLSADKEGGEKPELGGHKEGIPTGDEEESDIEEAINQHLAEMGIGEDENVEGHENIAAATKPFKKYVAERGYNPEKVEEISMMEMVGLMNSYTNECGDAPDAEGMSDYVTNEVHEKLAESGNSLFEDLMKPFGEKIKENKKAYAAEAVLPMTEHFGVEDGDEEGEEAGEPEGEEGSPENSIAVGEEPAGEESELEVGGEEEPVEVEKEISIAPAADTIALGTPMGSKTGEGSKSATVDLNAATITLTMNEAEQKLRKIVQKKLADRIAGKKVTLNEAKNSALSAMIDEAINEALSKRRAAIEQRLLRK